VPLPNILNDSALCHHPAGGQHIAQIYIADGLCHGPRLALSTGCRAAYCGDAQADPSEEPVRSSFAHVGIGSFRRLLDFCRDDVQNLRPGARSPQNAVDFSGLLEPIE